MTNKDYINAYSGDTRIIDDYYLYKSRFGTVYQLSGLVNPIKIDNRQLCAPTDNQHTTAHCTGYSAAQYAEAMHWKQTGELKQFDAHQIYSRAKVLDRKLDTDGSMLEYALSALIDLECIDATNKQMRFLYNSGTGTFVENFKFRLHQNDLLIGGFNISTEWYKCTNENFVISETGKTVGGHAVLICGYDSDGVYIQNSWGTNWGAKGFAIISWATFLKEFMYCVYLEPIKSDPNQDTQK